MKRKKQMVLHVWLNKYEAMTLLMVCQNPNGTALKQDAYSTPMGRTIMTMKTILDNLERWGLIEKHPNAKPPLWRATSAGENYFRHIR